MEELISSLNAWMQGSFDQALGACFLWGLVSVLLCPCHIAAIPLIAGYVGGQGGGLSGRWALWCAALFSLGIIITVTAIGLACAILGRVLGDISHYWAIPAGLVIIFLGLGLIRGLHSHGEAARAVWPRGLRGLPGALALGLLYGLLSGADVFAFLAPVLSVIAASGLVFKGTLMVCAFAVGHSLPLLAAGGGIPLLQKLLGHSGLMRAGLIGRMAAGCLVVAVGAYVLTTPFFHHH